MRLRALVAVAAAVLLVQSGPAFATAAPSGSVGHDVSYPQCTSAGASTSTVGALGGAFGIVGVTGGRPWGPNSCSGAEFSWASGLAGSPSLYMNTANPAPTSSYFWPTSGSVNPVLCKDASTTTDPGCAYDYGWHAAADALTKQAASLPGAGSLTWWLDIETANSWNGNGTSNAADLQGSVDYLRSHGVPQVGLYSTSYQWTTVTGGYNASTAASYASAWQSEFAAQYPMTSSPNWIAGLGTASDASSACGSSFSGGPTQLAQYNDGSGYDADLVCGATAPSAPQSLTATPQDGGAALTWSAPATSGGSVTYSVFRGTTPGGESSAPVGTSTSTSYTDLGLTNGVTYYYTVTATNSTGVSPLSNEASVTPAPAPQSFALSLNPASGTVKRGASITSTVTVTDTGSPQAVALAVSGMPAGVTASLSPSTVTGSGTSTLSIVVSATAARGTFVLTVTGTGSTAPQNVSYTLKTR